MYILKLVKLAFKFYRVVFFFLAEAGHISRYDFSTFI